MKLIKKILVSIIFFQSLISVYDLTLIGRYTFSDGLGRNPFCFIEMLKDKVTINCIPTQSMRASDAPTHIKQIIMSNLNNKPANVAILCDALWYNNYHPMKHMPQSPIKIAYSVFEATKIPEKWVEIINEKFDAVAVPDPFLVTVYKESGVRRPVFVLPHGLYLDDFLNQPIKKRKNKRFTFGMTGGFSPLKNHLMLVKAFAKEFGNSSQVKLIIHGRWGAGSPYYENLANVIKAAKLTNVQLLNTKFNQTEMINFMKSLDCYVLLSKGEGFSITPREALALGIPCILSNNSAHKNICKTNLVRAVKARVAVPADYGIKEFGDCGYFFDCKIRDVRTALRDVYTNYDIYLNKAQQGREWVKQYRHQNMSMRYHNLVKPKNLILGDHDEVTDEHLITASPILYTKYMRILKKTY